MTERKYLLDVSEEALRDHASAEVVDRIWDRLQPEIQVPRPGARRTSLWWAPAAALAVFASGVFVGLQLNRPAPVALVQPENQPEPAAAPAPQSRVKREPERSKQAPRRAQHVRSAIRHPSPTAVPAESSPPIAVPAPVPVPPPPPTEPVTVPAWQTLAAQLDYDSASTALASDGGFGAALARATPEQLMILHDIARATGDRIHALEALRQVVELHADDPNAPVAAWSLGNMLESAGDSQGAAQAYSAYRALSPQGDFAEDALARQVELVREQGDLTRAQGMAKQYVQEFSSGRHIEEMQQLADQARTPAASDSEIEDAESSPRGEAHSAAQSHPED